ncbi:MAG: carboxypeptidase regulatory-like domain-containing protein [Bacteroidales bacterium]|nr:carboxypeptidase regulatory-like domain-containing protein [Bacteroidales bacterium]
MKKILIVLFSISWIISVQAQERFVARIESPGVHDLSEFLKTGYDIASFAPGRYIDLVINQQELLNLQTRGYALKITQTETQVRANMIAGKALAGYRTYSDLYTELLNLQTAHPDICKLYDIGESRGKEYTGAAYNSYKHEVWAMKISDNVATEEDEPCIFYMGEHHAREPISLEVAMYILNHIVSNYGTDPAITSSVNNKQIWFMPLVNPNGHKIVTDEVDLWWRKNIRDNNGNSAIDGGTTDGVDLNRNYGWEWGGEGTSTNPADITYCGPSGFSEPETMAMKNMIDQHHFVAGITYHSYSELVLFPYGYSTGAFAPDHNSLQALAVSMANTIPAEGGGYYTPDKSSGLYPASGVTDDYAYGEHGIFSYTIELGTEFIPPAAEISSMCQNNLQAALILLNRIDKSTLTGIVKDASTLLPLQAEVTVSGIDNTAAFRKPYTSDEAFGRYYRMLPDGNYTVTFSLYGYIPQTFTNVNINNLAQTILNVNLVQAQTAEVTGTVTDLATGLPIAGATIEIMDTPIASVTTNASGFYTIPSIMEGTFDFRISKAGYATIIQTLIVSTANHTFNFQLEESTAWSFESGTFEPSWTFSGNAPWTISTESPYDGLYCSKSGAIGNSQNSDMSIELFLTSGGNVSFFRKVSSESGYDYLTFYIDGVQQGQWSGTVAWGEVSYTVAAGLHTFKWSYSKDVGVIGGSDCAWIDYIIFPPVAPIPDPANIVVTPAQFTETVGLNGTASDILTIGNTGEINLDYSAVVEYNASQGRASATIYPVNASYNTGTTTASAKTQTSLVKGYPTTEAGWMKFDVSSIPDGATINSVEFHGYVNATNYPYWNINPVAVDPVSATPSALYTDIMAESASGYYLYRSESSTYSPGWKVHPLGGNANANLQAALTQNWFAIGIMDRDASTSYYIGFDGWNEANKPYLVIDYTYVPPYNWLTIDGSGSSSGTVIPGGNNQISVGFNAGSLAAGTYTAGIRITSNDPDQSQVLIPCTLNISNNKNLNLTVLLEGLHNGPGTMRKAQGTSGDQFPGTVADQMTVELREAADYNNVVYTDPNVNLNTNGSASLVIPAENSGSYYVTIRHRNSIETTTALPLSFSGSDIINNFTTAASQAYGSNLQQAGGDFVIFGGDVNQDGAVDTGDMTPTDNDAGSFAGGYLPTDINGDGTVDTGDITVIDNNAAGFTGKVTP